MLRRLIILAFLTLLIIGLLTVLKPGPTPFGIPPAARAQEPVSGPVQLGPDLRDPASVASELLVDPSVPAITTPERPSSRWASRGYLNDVGNAVSRLRRQIVQFKLDVTTDLQGEPRRGLSREADNVLDALDDFETRLVTGRTRAAISEDYAAVEARVQALTRGVRAYGQERSLSRDPAGWVAMADERLGAAVSQGEVREAWEPVLVARESDNLVFLARELERKGEYSLSGGSDRRSLQSDLHALTDAAEFFRASVASASPRSDLMREFTTVEEVWAHVAPAVVRLSHGERLLLDPRASSVADVVLKLHRRLGLPGAPARLEAGAGTVPTAKSYGLALPASPR